MGINVAVGLVAIDFDTLRVDVHSRSTYVDLFVVVFLLVMLQKFVNVGSVQPG